jgi:Uma2 family endonuclease
MNAALKITTLSPEDYLKGEEIRPIRYEYVDGEVYAMEEESESHNIIALNFALLLKNHLRGSPCRVFMENIKVHIKTATTERFYYPDLQVKCGGISSKNQIITHPKLIVEILSPSTERYDRSNKFYAYRQLESLEEYVLVAQDEKRIEIYRRETNWEWELYQENTPTKPYLKSVDIELSFDDIYEDILFQ